MLEEKRVGNAQEKPPLDFSLNAYMLRDMFRLFCVVGAFSRLKRKKSLEANSQEIIFPCENTKTFCTKGTRHIL